TVIKVECNPMTREICITNTIGEEKYLFSSKIGEKILKRLSSEIGFKYTIVQNQNFYQIKLIF
ncbi:hypothetical protein, partial [Sulfuricurvum sp.]|uniref:hypothetical protein n=1 Tax=Sulfuricurvum sp. TaxID=2025608 RepID=UPI003BB509E0